jgi:hypothetical protein
VNAKDRQERNQRALELHLAGATYERIAQVLGFASKATAHKAVKDALAARPLPEEGEDPATVELARLDAMLVGLWPQARKGNVAAVDRVLKISERRVALMALANRPATGSAPVDPLDELRQRRDSKRAG